jgi:hypothetical protein
LVVHGQILVGRWVDVSGGESLMPHVEDIGVEVRKIDSDERAAMVDISWERRHTSIALEEIADVLLVGVIDLDEEGALSGAGSNPVLDPGGRRETVVITVSMSD